MLKKHFETPENPTGKQHRSKSGKGAPDKVLIRVPQQVPGGGGARPPRHLRPPSQRRGRRWWIRPPGMLWVTQNVVSLDVLQRWIMAQGRYWLGVCVLPCNICHEIRSAERPKTKQLKTGGQESHCIGDITTSCRWPCRWSRTSLAVLKQRRVPPRVACMLT